MDDEREKLLDFLLSQLQVRHFKSKFNPKKEYSVVELTNDRIALYDIDIDSEMFNKLVKELEERGNGKKWINF